MKLGLTTLERAYLGADSVKSVALGGSVLLTEAELLLHFEGSLADSTSSAHTVTAFGDAAVASGTPSLFGSGSAALPGATGDYMQATASGTEFAFGTGDFTVELVAYPIAVPGDDLAALVDTRVTGGGAGVMLWQDDASGKWVAYASSAGNTLQSVITGPLVALNTWTHLALTRQGDTLRLFVNGIQAGSANISGYDFTGGNCWIGTAADDPGNFRNFTGYLDELRIVKGLAVYTGPFTAPATELSAIVRREVGVSAVSGCTDPAATNYDSLANVEDGSCTY